MARLPAVESAILDVRKLEDYCLNPEHLRGRHKARLFREVLGIGQGESAWLRQSLLEGVRKNEAIPLALDIFGTRWRVDVPVERHGRRAVIRSIWIVRVGESGPRFVSCWVL